MPRLRGLTRRLFLTFSELQVRVDGVSATSRHRDAVDAAVRESARRRPCHTGWCIKYEYNTADLTACILFLEGHLYAGPISWSTLQCMVSEVLYGGKIVSGAYRC